MHEGSSYKHINLFDILSNANTIVRSDKGIEETMIDIVDSFNSNSNLTSGTALRIKYNNEQYSSRYFNSNTVCFTSNFIAESGNRGQIQICSNHDKESKDYLREEDRIYLADNLGIILLDFINRKEKSADLSKGDLAGESYNNSSGPVSSRFLQRFLNKYTYNRDIYHDLMPFKVKEILLISSLYDAYSIESEGRFSEHMLGQYGQLNLTSFPRITGASSLKQALELLQHKSFELVIYMVGVDKKTPLLICEEIKKAYPFIPIFLLLNNTAEVGYFTENINDIFFVDKIFTWTGDANIFFSMIKLLEDKINARNDTELGKVRTILLVEDSPVYYSRYLSFLYKVLMEQTKSIIDDVSTDELYKVLRMRARPKILLATNYEEALEVIKDYKEYLTCIITDVKFEKDGVFDEMAGIRLLEYVKKELKNLPTVLQSSDSSYQSVADTFNSLFIHKYSDTLYQDLEHFITNYLGFGSFEFKDQVGNIIAVATSLHEFETFIKKIPDDSLLFHASRDHFSMWRMARGEIRAAKIINSRKVKDYETANELRKELVFLLKENRNERDTGNVIPFNKNNEISDENVYTLSGGSLGGKGRGLAFIDALIHNFKFEKFISDVKVRTPKTFVIGTHEFETFMRSNKLKVQDINNYSRVKKLFVTGKLSDELRSKLSDLLDILKKPLAVRSSGMFEDSLSQPFAGIFETYLLPNNDPDKEIRLSQVETAIKLVMASVYSSTAKGYVKAIDYKIEEEKMAVIIQEVVGNQYEKLYYPHIRPIVFRQIIPAQK